MPLAPDWVSHLRVLFHTHYLGHTRHFEGLISALSRAGHEVVLSTRPVPLSKGTHQSTRDVYSPVSRADEWQNLAQSIRQLNGHLHYLLPEFISAGELRARSLHNMPLCLRPFFGAEGMASWSKLAALVGSELHLESVTSPSWKIDDVTNAKRILASIEDAIPPADNFCKFVEELSPALLLVTCLVFPDSEYQADIVKAARALRIPTVFLPFSWDNLTTKGSTTVWPDLSLVWNACQVAELTSLHGLTQERIEISGAGRFDRFYARHPKLARSAYLESMGFSPGAPLIAYLGSSPFMAPHEEVFFKDWFQGLREHSGSAVRRANVVARPHPRNAEGWKGTEGNGLVVVFDRSEEGLFELLKHCDLAVALNTSAMIEASILGVPVVTPVTRETREGQEGTMHFEYFRTVGGGLIHESRDLEGHYKTLGWALVNREEAEAKSVQFASKFTRPRGEGAVSPVLALRLEQFVAEHAGLVDDGARMIPTITPDALRSVQGLIQPAEHYTPGSLERVQYGKADIYIRVSNRMERDWRLTGPDKEPWTIEWMEQMFSPGDIVYDIGANVGVFSLIAASIVGGTGAVIAFEPGVTSYSQLCENIHSNNLSERIFPIPLPLSEEPGTAVFIYRSLEAGQSRHKLRKRPMGRRPSQRTLVSTLDQIVAEFQVPAPNHMKVDVGGAELDVLKGGRDLLRNPTLRTVLVEAELPLAERIEALMGRCGFKEGIVLRAGDASIAQYVLYKRSSATASRSKIVAKLFNLRKIRLHNRTPTPGSDRTLLSASEGGYESEQTLEKRFFQKPSI